MSFSQAERLYVFEAKSTCAWPGCEGGGDHIHHRLPRSQGGTDALWNLALLCRHHHLFTHSIIGRDVAIKHGMLLTPLLAFLEDLERRSGEF